VLCIPGELLNLLQMIGQTASPHSRCRRWPPASPAPSARGRSPAACAATSSPLLSFQQVLNRVLTPTLTLAPTPPALSLPRVQGCFPGTSSRHRRKMCATESCRRACAVSTACCALCHPCFFLSEHHVDHQSTLILEPCLGRRAHGTDRQRSGGHVRGVGTVLGRRRR